MGSKSKIEWTESTWDTFAGCTPVSPGCSNCYAARTAVRMQGAGVPGFAGVVRSTNDGPKWTTIVMPRPTFEQPLRWKTPRRVFVNSQSDTFHENMPDSLIDGIFGIMLASHFLENQAKHTYQVLTKRVARMRRYLSRPPAELLLRWARAVDPIVSLTDEDGSESAACFSELVEGHCSRRWDADGNALVGTRDNESMGYPENLFPLPNVWIGASVEDNQRLLERYSDLMATPAAKRWLSIEPLLGRLGSLEHTLAITGDSTSHFRTTARDYLHWVVVGGESGPRARPMHPAWAREIRDLCQLHHIPFFFKQWGEWLPIAPEEWREDDKHGVMWPDGMRESGIIRGGHTDEELFAKGLVAIYRAGKKAAGNILDGRKWEEYPT